MHAGKPEAGRQALHIDFQRLEDTPLPTGGTQSSAGVASGLVSHLPGVNQNRSTTEGVGAQADVAGALRQAMQGAFSGLDAPIQELQGQVRNLYGATHDIWAVNVEEEYHEESRPAAGGG